MFGQRQDMTRLRPGQPPEPIPMDGASVLHIIYAVRVGDERVVASSAPADIHGSIARAPGPLPIPCV
eukprot:7066182-Pyramimonas_sp.AAC.1